MPVVIALLRAVNVGSRNRIRMETLRRLCESLGCEHVQTHIQSGNILLRVADRQVAKIAGRIEDAIEAEAGFRPVVVTRSVAELRDAIDRNPFASRKGLDPRKLLVVFLAAEPAPESRHKLLAMNTEPEEVHLGKREMYMYFPNGMGRPKTSPAAIEKACSVPGTGRNWKVVNDLLALAEKLEAKQT
jgi:uncharacterized protein (DUF1697 family)